MQKIILFVFFSALLAACSSGPDPLKYGTDVCHFCKMTLMDDRFGAELVTTKNKVYKFDDMNCFLNFYNSGTLKERDVQLLLVANYDLAGQLINAKDAFYLKSEEIRSPMNGQVAAFANKSSLDELKEKVGGIYLSWGEAVTLYK